jgi:hypothetical protein
MQNGYVLYATVRRKPNYYMRMVFIIRCVCVCVCERERERQRERQRQRQTQRMN